MADFLRGYKKLAGNVFPSFLQGTHPMVKPWMAAKNAYAGGKQVSIEEQGRKAIAAARNRKSTSKSPSKGGKQWGGRSKSSSSEYIDAPWATEVPGDTQSYDEWLAMLGLGAPPGMSFDATEFENLARMLGTQSRLASEMGTEGQAKLTGAYAGLKQSDIAAKQGVLGRSDQTNANVAGIYDKATADVDARAAANQKAIEEESARLGTGMAGSQIAAKNTAALTGQNLAGNLTTAAAAQATAGEQMKQSSDALFTNLISTGQLQGQESKDTLAREVRRYLLENQDAQSANQAKKAAAYRAWQEQQAQDRWKYDTDLRFKYLESMGGDEEEGPMITSGMGGAAQLIDRSGSPNKQLIQRFVREDAPMLSKFIRDGQIWIEGTEQNPEGHVVKATPQNLIPYYFKAFKKKYGRDPTEQDKGLIIDTIYTLQGGLTGQVY